MYDVQNSLIFFLIVFFVSIIVGILVSYFDKKNNSLHKYIRGYFGTMNQRHVISFSLLYLNFFFLCFSLLGKFRFSFIYVVISSILVFGSFGILRNRKKLIIDFLINLINISFLYLSYLVNILRTNSPNPSNFVLQVVFNLLSLFLFFLTTGVFFNDIKKGGDIICKKKS